jgi:ferredoxin
VPKVHFLNEAIEVEAASGQTLREIAEQHGIVLVRGLFPGLHCRGRGICGRCRVWAMPRGEGALTPLTFWERLRRYRGARRLACQAKVMGDVEVRTTPNAQPPTQTTIWPEDTRPAKWKERRAASAEPAAPQPAATTAAPAARPTAGTPAAPAPAAPAPAAPVPPSATPASATSAHPTGSPSDTYAEVAGAPRPVEPDATPESSKKTLAASPPPAGADS